jgi:hypothetical protein
MEIRACGGCKPDRPRKCGEPVEVGRSDPGESHLDGFAATLAKLAEQTSQGAAG